MGPFFPGDVGDTVANAARDLEPIRDLIANAGKNTARTLTVNPDLFGGSKPTVNFLTNGADDGGTGLDTFTLGGLTNKGWGNISLDGDDSFNLINGDLGDMGTLFTQGSDILSRLQATADTENTDVGTLRILSNDGNNDPDAWLQIFNENKNEPNFTNIGRARLASVNNDSDSDNNMSWLNGAFSANMGTLSDQVLNLRGGDLASALDFFKPNDDDMMKRLVGSANRNTNWFQMNHADPDRGGGMLGGALQWLSGDNGVMSRGLNTGFSLTGNENALGFGPSGNDNNFFAFAPNINMARSLPMNNVGNFLTSRNFNNNAQYAGDLSNFNNVGNFLNLGQNPGQGGFYNAFLQGGGGGLLT